MSPLKKTSDLTMLSLKFCSYFTEYRWIPKLKYSELLNMYDKIKYPCVSFNLSTKQDKY